MRHVLLGCALLLATTLGLAAGPPVVEPVMENGKPVMQAHEGKNYPVFRAAADQKLVAAIEQVFTTSFARESQKLLDVSREIASARNRRSGVADPPEFAQPLYLLLSQEDGGFARRDFFLQDASGKANFVTADYIDLEVDQHSVEIGDFEEVFCHEVGHTILHNLVGDLVGPRSNKMHQSMTLTDYRTAFDEGFAEHFQPVAREYSSNPFLQRLDHGGEAQQLSVEFFNQRDDQMRNFGPRMDLFVYDRLVSPCASVRECFVVEESSASFDTYQLRTGQQMLSSEGVAATVFYHLATQASGNGCTRSEGKLGDCSVLQARYREMFEALGEVKPSASQAPLIQFLDAYRAKFPDEAKKATYDFLLLTRGATASVDALRTTHELERTSARADLQPYVKLQHALQDLLLKLRDDVFAGRVKLDAAVGPELWVRNEAFTHASLWSEGEESPLRINLNTASAEELATLPQFAMETAQTIVRQRRQRGYFNSIDELISAAKLSAAYTEILKQAERSQATAKPDPVQ